MYFRCEAEAEAEVRGSDILKIKDADLEISISRTAGIRRETHGAEKSGESCELWLPRLAVIGGSVTIKRRLP